MLWCVCGERESHITASCVCVLCAHGVVLCVRERERERERDRESERECITAVAPSLQNKDPLAGFDPHLGVEMGRFRSGAGWV